MGEGTSRSWPPLNHGCLSADVRQASRLERIGPCASQCLDSQWSPARRRNCTARTPYEFNITSLLYDRIDTSKTSYYTTITAASAVGGGATALCGVRGVTLCDSLWVTLTTPFLRLCPRLDLQTSFQDRLRSMPEGKILKRHTTPSPPFPPPFPPIVPPPSQTSTKTLLLNPAHALIHLDAHPALAGEEGLSLPLTSTSSPITNPPRHAERPPTASRDETRSETKSAAGSRRKTR